MAPVTNIRYGENVSGPDLVFPKWQHPARVSVISWLLHLLLPFPPPTLPLHVLQLEHFFTLHFPKMSESFYFSLFTSRTPQTHSWWDPVHQSSTDCCTSSPFLLPPPFHPCWDSQCNVKWQHPASTNWYCCTSSFSLPPFLLSSCWLGQPLLKEEYLSIKEHC